MKKTALPALLVAGLSVAMSLPAAAQDTPMGDGATIRVLSNPAGTQSFPPYVIERFGLDERYGFDLEIVPAGNTGAMLTALQAGAAEMAVLDWVTVARMRHNGVPLIGLVPFLTYVNTIIVPADSEIETVADMAGHRIGALSANGFDWIMTRTAALQAGVDLEASSEIVEGAPTLMRGMLEGGQIDVTLMYNSLTPDIVVGGDYRVMTTIRALANEMGIPDVPFIMYAANEDWMAEQPRNAAAFAAAYRDAAEILMTNDQVWVDRAVGEMGMDPAAAEAFRDEVRADLLTHFSDTDNEALRTTFALLLDTAGAEVLGFDTMPDRTVSLEFNQ